MPYSPDRLQTDFDRPPGRRARKALVVRRALLDAGLAAFGRVPLGMVSILDITEAADVAKGVFYLQFRSKDDFLIALLDDLQRVFLDSVRHAVGGCVTDRERLEAAIREYTRTATSSPATARFRLRMSGYFADEIGRPGELIRLRQEYHEQLAATISDARIDEVEPRDLRVSMAVDACCWGLVSHAIQTGSPLPDEDLFVETVRGAVEPYLA